MLLGWLFFLVANISLIPSTKTECPQNLTSVVNTSKTGILIETEILGVKKCMAASDEMFNINGTLVYKIIWRNCSSGDLWKLTWTHGSFLQNGKFVNMIQISQLNSDLRLDWVQRSDGWVIAYLVNRENITNKDLFIDKTGHGGYDFCIQGLQHKNVEENIFLLIVGATMTDSIKRPIFLEHIKFVAPGPEHSCNLEKLNIENGELVKDDSMHASMLNTTTKVLLGKTITIQCNPGYGVKDLNYTTVQEIKCYNAARPRACSKINSPISNMEKSTVGILSLIMVLVISLPCLLIVCYNKKSSEQ